MHRFQAYFVESPDRQRVELHRTIFEAVGSKRECVSGQLQPIAGLSSGLVHDQDSERRQPILGAVVHDSAELFGKNLGLLVPEQFHDLLICPGLAPGGAADEDLPDLASSRILRRTIIEESNGHDQNDPFVSNHEEIGRETGMTGRE